MHSRIKEYKKLLNQVFRNHKVERAYVFGSATTNDFNEKSDVDFLIKFEDGIDPLERGELWWNLHDTLRDMLKREVDLITENSLKNPFFIKEIESTKNLIHG